ncbi:hypothetical protein CUMW_260140 [Citrus unshiu]|uniref:Uncharacterized protein n=1 Tax=Citrus unshiu TaxID=55188 RepID=A0A2H5QTG5_CITUN|nr:hypothetical protein CUMW_260140 [Citrus unshiu]
MEDPNTNEGELFRHPEDGNELQKEVFAALFSAPEKSDEFPEITVKTKCEVQSIRKGGFLISATYWRTNGKLYTGISAITNGNYDINIISRLENCVTDILCGSGILKILQ